LSKFFICVNIRITAGPSVTRMTDGKNQEEHRKDELNANFASFSPERPWRKTKFASRRACVFSAPDRGWCRNGRLSISRVREFAQFQIAASCCKISQSIRPPSCLLSIRVGAAWNSARQIRMRADQAANWCRESKHPMPARLRRRGREDRAQRAALGANDPRVSAPTGPARDPAPDIRSRFRKSPAESASAALSRKRDRCPCTRHAKHQRRGAFNSQKKSTPPKGQRYPAAIRSKRASAAWPFEPGTASPISRENVHECGLRRWQIRLFERRRKPQPRPTRPRAPDAARIRSPRRATAARTKKNSEKE